MWTSLSEYIERNYGKDSKIVEVGVGKLPDVALALKEHLKIDIIMTDIKDSPLTIKDDICHPALKIYKGAGLIYSIRPPEELHPCLVKVAKNIKADLIIKPLSTDNINSRENFTLVNYKRASFYRIRFK